MEKHKVGCEATICNQIAVEFRLPSDIFRVSVERRKCKSLKERC